MKWLHYCLGMMMSSMKFYWLYDTQSHLHIMFLSFSICQCQRHFFRITGYLGRIIMKGGSIGTFLSCLTLNLSTINLFVIVDAFSSFKIISMIHAHFQIKILITEETWYFLLISFWTMHPSYSLNNDPYFYVSVCSHFIHKTQIFIC